MFSKRLRWETQRNRIGIATAALRASGAEVLDLTESNPTQAGFDYPPDLLETLTRPLGLLYQPEAAGIASAREAVAGYYSRRGIRFDPAQVLLCASTSEAYGHLFKLLADPGDEILIPQPSYPLFDFLAALENCRTVPYPLLYDHGWHLDLDALSERVAPRTRAIVTVHPNNPTGSYLKIREAAALRAFCAARDLALISDEVFLDYPFEPSDERSGPLALAGDCLSFSLGGLSKAAGLPQWKVGWIVAGGPEPLRRSALDRLEWILDTYLSVSTPAQLSLPSVLEAAEAIQEQIQIRTRWNLAWLQVELEQRPELQLLEAEGGWYATLRVPQIASEEEWVLGLLETGHTLVQPGFFYDFPSEAFLVLSLLTEPAVFRRGLAQLLDYAGRLLSSS